MLIVVLGCAVLSVAAGRRFFYARNAAVGAAEWARAAVACGDVESGFGACSVVGGGRGQMLVLSAGAGGAWGC